MNNLTVTKTIHIAATLTVSDWSLYDLPGAGNVATVLSRNLAYYVNRNFSRSEVREVMHNIMRQDEYSKFGSCDTAVIEVLDYVLDEIYGEH